MLRTKTYGAPCSIGSLVLNIVRFLHDNHIGNEDHENSYINQTFKPNWHHCDTYYVQPNLLTPTYFVISPPANLDGLLNLMHIFKLYLKMTAMEFYLPFLKQLILKKLPDRI